ncbi:MAG: transcription-repair coupling factor, partial [Campylobacterota bacterium]|nr:transcription-repair coupling factor [Campylobacterota bacterium]
MSQSRLFQYFKTEQNQDLEILICEDYKEATELQSVAKFFDKDVLLFPDFRPSFGDDLRVYKEELHQLFNSLKSYNTKKKKPLVISPLKTLLFHLPVESLLESTKLEFGSKINLSAFKEQMLFWGYNFVDMVQVEGEISFRGDIIDIYAPASQKPIRVSLFDDEIEQIKEFELETQRTLKEELDSFDITAAFYSLDENSFNALNDRVQNSEYDSLVKDV